MYYICGEYYISIYNASAHELRIGSPGLVSKEVRQYDEVKTNFSQFYNFIFPGLQIFIALLYTEEYEIYSRIKDTVKKINKKSTSSLILPEIAKQKKT